MPIESVLRSYWQGQHVDYLKNYGKKRQIKLQLKDDKKVYLLLMILDDNSLEVAVEEVTLAMGVHWPIVCKAMIVKRGDFEVYFRETSFYVDQFLKVSVCEDTME